MHLWAASHTLEHYNPGVYNRTLRRFSKIQCAVPRTWACPPCGTPPFGGEWFGAKGVPRKCRDARREFLFNFFEYDRKSEVGDTVTHGDAVTWTLVV